MEASLLGYGMQPRSQPEEIVAELPENPDNSFAQSVQGEIDLERQRVNEDYWKSLGQRKHRHNG